MLCTAISTVRPFGMNRSLTCTSFNATFGILGSETNSRRVSLIIMPTCRNRWPDLMHFLVSTILPVRMSRKQQHGEGHHNCDCILTCHVEHLGVVKDRLEREGGTSVSRSIGSTSSHQHLSQEVVTIATFGSVLEGLLPGSDDFIQKVRGLRVLKPWALMLSALDMQ